MKKVTTPSRSMGIKSSHSVKLSKLSPSRFCAISVGSGVTSARQEFSIRSLGIVLVASHHQVWGKFWEAESDQNPLKACKGKNKSECREEKEKETATKKEKKDKEKGKGKK
ncbi:hypothetical protein CR513_24196, partial [Mucuna pruriens]